MRPAPTLRTESLEEPRDGDLETVRLAVLFDVLAAVVVVLTTLAWGDRRSWPRLAVVGGGWIALAIACWNGSPGALSLRRFAGLVAVAWIVVGLVTGVRIGAAFPVVAAVALVLELAFGSAACHAALVVRRKRSAERREQRRLDRARAGRPAVPPSGAPAAPRWRRLSIAVAVAGAVWVASGVVESARGNWYLGLVVVAVGVLSLLRSPNLGPTRTDARLRGRPGVGRASWVVVPLGALGLLVRVAWLLGFLGSGPR
jgi:hypothetical protein